MKSAHVFRQCESEPSSFVPLGVSEEAKQRVERKRARCECRVYRGQDGFEVAVPEHVMARVVAFGQQSEPDEWYGLLIGQLCEDYDGEHVVVHGVVPDTGVSASPGSIATTTQSEYRTRIAARTLYPDATILGWVHTHPRMRARFSHPDLRNQTTWTQPHSLGLVIDPWNATDAAMYRGPHAELLSMVAGAEPGALPDRSRPDDEAHAKQTFRLERRAARSARIRAFGRMAFGSLVFAAAVAVSSVSAKAYREVTFMITRADEFESRMSAVESNANVIQGGVFDLQAKSLRMQRVRRPVAQYCAEFGSTDSEPTMCDSEPSAQ